MVNDKQIEQETRDVRVTNSKEQWQKFDNWIARYGYQSLAEGFRSAMNQIIETEFTQINPPCQVNSGQGGK